MISAAVGVVMLLGVLQQRTTTAGTHAPSSPPAGCAVIAQANVVSGTSGLGGTGSTATVKFLGKFQTPEQCTAACTANSTARDPCRSWAFYYPDTPQREYQGSCYGRHDDVWAPHRDISRTHNHVCTAKSCKYPPLPPYPPPPSPTPPLPPLPPLPQRPLAPVDPDLLPIMYLGGVDQDGTSVSNYTRACTFQVVAIINSYCWNARSDTHHKECSNHSAEFQYIIDQSHALKQKCPGVLTQMYLNSMMNFWWYTSIFRRFDPSQGGNQSLLLHDVSGNLVRVLQDGGNPNISVYDWGQAATRDTFMEFVSRALESGITSFFLDKASTSAHGNQICNHICDEVTPSVAHAWSLGHREVLRQVASNSTGPTVGNGGADLLEVMGGAHMPFDATEASIKALQAVQAKNTTSAIAAGFPFSRSGYAAFLIGYEQGRSFMWTYTLDPDKIWIEEFDHRLGSPLSKAKLDVEARVYTREFTHATVSFDAGHNVGHFVWKHAR